jgi:hypothetical protein
MYIVILLQKNWFYWALKKQVISTCTTEKLIFRSDEFRKEAIAAHSPTYMYVYSKHVYNNIYVLCPTEEKSDVSGPNQSMKNVQLRSICYAREISVL